MHIIYLLHSFECRIYIHPRNTPSLTNVSTHTKKVFAEILNGKLYFLCIVYHSKARLSTIFLKKFILATSILLFRWWGVGTVLNYVFLQNATDKNHYSLNNKQRKLCVIVTYFMAKNSFVAETTFNTFMTESVII